jgi:hypothetical protein
VTSKDVSVLASRIFDRLNDRLCDMYGVRSEWRRIEPSVRDTEIRGEWEKIITDEVTQMLSDSENQGENGRRRKRHDP